MGFNLSFCSELGFVLFFPNLGVRVSEVEALEDDKHIVVTCKDGELRKSREGFWLC